MLRTLGHACFALYREGADPMLVTDPWLVGSVYWRSWWLQNYPSAEKVDWLANSACVYVTHEHPDHFHMPTIPPPRQQSAIFISGAGGARLPRSYDAARISRRDRRTVKVAGDRGRGFNHVDPGVERR